MCAVMAGVSLLGIAACGSKSKVKIGVLIFNATDTEMLAFRGYLEKYIKEEYPEIDWAFINPGTAAESAIANVEDLVSQGCKGIIGFTDTVEVVSKANDSGVHYIKAAGQTKAVIHNEIKNFEYYVGSIGPSLEIEEEKIGYEMMKHFIDSPANGGKGYTKVLINGVLIQLGSIMHTTRYNGMKRALKEIAGVEISAGTPGAPMGTVTANPKDLTVILLEGYPGLTEGFAENASTIIKNAARDGLQAIASNAGGVEALGGILLNNNLTSTVDLATVSAFTPNYKTAFDNGTLDYLVGKFASSMGPAVVALINSINGNGHRTANGEAFKLDQPYWIARSKAEFDEQYANDQPSSPAYTKALLDKFIVSSNNKVSFDEFAAFVKASSYAEIQALKKTV